MPAHYNITEKKKMHMGCHSLVAQYRATCNQVSKSRYSIKLLYPQTKGVKRKCSKFILTIVSVMQ